MQVEDDWVGRRQTMGIPGVSEEATTVRQIHREGGGGVKNFSVNKENSYTTYSITVGSHQMSRS